MESMRSLINPGVLKLQRLIPIVVGIAEQAFAAGIEYARQETVDHNLSHDTGEKSVDGYLVTVEWNLHIDDPQEPSVAASINFRDDANDYFSLLIVRCNVGDDLVPRWEIRSEFDGEMSPLLAANFAEVLAYDGKEMPTDAVPKSIRHMFEYYVNLPSV